ncbi:phage holin family protein [Actinomyces sp. ICM47]|uniref:phage holin family protein n=1 Tax=Actinomyces sp. ICM47 TaxID=936548 RepID=UPI0025C3531D|nr:phage holin family protein [Actinomyces sp. ICM47]
MDFIARLVATMAGLWVTTLLVPSISITSTTASETVIAFAVIAFVFTLVNSIIKPIVKTLAFPLYLLTFGLFSLVTNSLLFALTGWLSTSLSIPMTTGGFLSCLAGAVITSVVASVVSGVLRDKKDARD